MALGCFRPLTNGEYDEKPMGALLRGELRSALGDGILAAGIVLVVLVAGGTPPGLTAGAALGAIALAILLHQFVLILGVGVLRLHTNRGLRLSGS